MPIVLEMLGASNCGFTPVSKALMTSGNATNRPSELTNFTTQVELRM